MTPALIFAAMVGAYFLPQVGTTAFLIRRIARPTAPMRIWEKLVHIVALVLAPTAMLLLAMAAFEADWKGERAYGWIGVMDAGEPGTVILPVWLTACCFLTAGIVRSRRLFTNKFTFLMIATLALIGFWYVGMFPIYTGLTSPDSGLDATLTAEGFLDAFGVLILVTAPAILCLNLVLLMAGILRRGELAGSFMPWALAWLGTLTATAVIKCVVAMRFYESLPDEPPCFIVTAAARGHRRFVGNEAPSGAVRPANRQLRTMRALEARLAGRHAPLHRSLRRIYNIIGPAVAARLRSPLAADIAYVILKPVELLGACYLRCAREERGLSR